MQCSAVTATDVTQRELARRVVDTARELQEHPRLVTADKPIVVAGPNGTWKIRMYKSGRGYLNLHVVGPGASTVFYSVTALNAYMRDVVGIDLTTEAPMEVEDERDPNNTNMEEDSPPEESSEASPHERACINRIQTAYRANRLMICVKDVARLRDRIVQVAQVRDRSLALFHASVDIEDAYATAHPHVKIYLPCTALGTDSICSTRLPVTDLLSVAFDRTGFTRDHIMKVAADVLSRFVARNPAHKCAKAIQYDNHFPLIFASLPTPSYSFASVTLLNTCVYACSTETISSNHALLVVGTYGNAWLDHLKHIMDVRAVTAYDFFADRQKKTYVGSIVLSKFVVQMRAAGYPAISVESITCKERGKGTGTRMMEFTKRILFGDGTVTHGFIFAQCLKVDFWEFRLDETVAAKTLVFQMDMLYPSYTFETNCTCRARLFTNEDRNTPSPVKRLCGDDADAGA